MYGSFFLIGVTMGMTGPLLPFLRHDLHLSYGEAGLLFSAQSLGSFGVLFLGGWLTHRIGKRPLLTTGVLLFFGGMLLTALAPNMTFVLLGNLILGIAMSLFDIGVSTLCLEAPWEGKGQALNRLHFYFGAGAVAGPLVALALSPFEGGWRWAFAVVGVAPLILLPLLKKVALPPSPAAPGVQRSAVYRKGLLWWGAVALFVYCGVEWGLGAWFPSYWKNLPQAAGLDPAWATSLFWLTFAVGRFVVGRWADAWGFVRFLVIALTLTVLLTGLWIVFPRPEISLVWVLLLGFVLAGQYPTFVALISQKFPHSSGQVTSFLSIFASLGTFFWPPAVGAWADAQGIAALPWAQMVMALLLVGGAVVTFRAVRRFRA